VSENKLFRRIFETERGESGIVYDGKLGDL
jgi:hypothetical protein